MNSDGMNGYAPDCMAALSVRLPPETAKKRPFAREISFSPWNTTTIIITSNVFCVYDNSVMPEELMTGSTRHAISLATASI
jgi:hypothetical protein